MAFKDVLLHLNSYPEATPASTIAWAVNMAHSLEASLTALAVNIELPHVSNPLANRLLDVPAMVAAERQKSEASTRALVAEFKAAAAERGVPHGHVVASCHSSQLGDLVTDHARTRDLTLIPISEEAGMQQFIAESVIFGSGRPTLIFPETPRRVSPPVLETVGIAWDFSRPASRAVADAMPILRRAKTVRVLTVTHEKRLSSGLSGAELARHLACHGVEAVLDEEAAAGRPIGQVLDDYAVRQGLGLLVMGAYGHSRLRDFVLGGATKTVVSHPRLPVLLSH